MRDDFSSDPAFAVIRKVIHEWDPYGLIEIGCPSDEWDGEINRLVKQVPQIKSEQDAINAVSDEFSAAFQPENFSREDCKDAGRALFTALDQAHLLNY